MDPDIYNHLNKHWISTCKILLGQDKDGLVELKDYASWLYSGNGPRLVKSSARSGKEVVYSSDGYGRYGNNNQWLSYDEVDLNQKYGPLGINDIKDIDSILEAARDKITYAGNMVLGNSEFIDDSTTINDCHYVVHSERVAFSKNVAYSSRGGYSENIFGCYGFGPVQFAIKSYGVTESTRLFMVSKADFSSDIYYSHGLSNCSECMFSFNLLSKRYAIGNLVLPKDKYAKLKTKLLAEVAEKLRKDRQLPSISYLVKQAKPDYSGLTLIVSAGVISKAKDKKYDKHRIEGAFTQTTNVLFGKPLNDVDEYASWLKRCSSILLKPAKSCASGKQLILPDYAGFLDYPSDRLLTQEEANLAGEQLALSETDVELLSIENAPSVLQKIAYFCPSWDAGKLENNIDSPLNIDSRDCYAGILYIRSKLCAFSFCPRSCEYCFGSREPRHVSFSINSHFSVRLTRCFEMDHCSDCSDCYFCHNCENLNNCMFCFNVKSKRYAIANVEVGKEKYLRVKKILLDYLNKCLQKDKSIRLSIFNLRSGI